MNNDNENKCKYGNGCIRNNVDHNEKCHGKCSYGDKCIRTNKEHIEKYHTLTCTNCGIKRKIIESSGGGETLLCYDCRG